jgi:hypothetical protein
MQITSRDLVQMKDQDGKSKSEVIGEQYILKHPVQGAALNAVKLV